MTEKITSNTIERNSSKSKRIAHFIDREAVGKINLIGNDICIRIETFYCFSGSSSIIFINEHRRADCM